MVKAKFSALLGTLLIILVCTNVEILHAISIPYRKFVTPHEKFDLSFPCILSLRRGFDQEANSLQALVKFCPKNESFSLAKYFNPRREFSTRRSSVINFNFTPTQKRAHFQGAITTEIRCAAKSRAMLFCGIIGA
jgi:hypothetical protein